MNKLEPCTTSGPKKWREFLAQCRASETMRDFPKEALWNTWQHLRRCKHYMNDIYHVAVDPETEHGFPDSDVWHLSIKRHDREPIFDWRELQEVKNQICGSEAEGLMLFPAESRVVDTANQYHIYAVMRQGDTQFPQVPFGMFGGIKQESADGAINRPFKEQ